MHTELTIFAAFNDEMLASYVLCVDRLYRLVLVNRQPKLIFFRIQIVSGLPVSCLDIGSTKKFIFRLFLTKRISYGKSHLKLKNE